MPDEAPRVLGIDPGTLSTGYGLVAVSGSECIYVASGTIRTGAGGALSRRLKTIYDDLLILLAEYRPRAVAIEGTFMDKNSQSAIKLGQARGVALLAAEQSGVPIVEYAPAQVKMAVAGYGAAGKDQIRKMVTRLLKLSIELDSEHAADALAVAICHLHSARLSEAVRRAAPANVRPDMGRSA